MAKRAYVYRITNTKNGKSYIGTTNLAKPHHRFQKHILISRNKELYLQNRTFRELHQAIVDDGEASFLFEVLEECQPHLRYQREKHWIRHHGTYGEGGYNRTRGGQGFTARHSPETIEILRENGKEQYARDKNPAFGRPLTAEHKEKLRLGRERRLERQRRLQKSPAHEAAVRRRLKLSKEDVREIRRLRGRGVPVKELADKFKVSVPCVYKVLKRKRKIDSK